MRQTVTLDLSSFILEEALVALGRLVRAPYRHVQYAGYPAEVIEVVTDNMVKVDDKIIYASDRIEVGQ